jgi:predicted secreted Zn-dependent protease
MTISNVVVSVNFDRSQSWVDPNSKFDELLNHEQGHFDLAHIYGKRLRSEVATIGSRTSTADELGLALSQASAELNGAIDQFYYQFMDHYEGEQARYDAETNHSQNLDAQNQWNAFFRSNI